MLSFYKAANSALAAASNDAPLSVKYGTAAWKGLSYSGNFLRSPAGVGAGCQPLRLTAVK
jgi:hypothetical protein